MSKFVAVLVASFENSRNELVGVDDYAVTPAHHFDCTPAGEPVSRGGKATFPALVTCADYTFAYIPVRKASAFAAIRDLVHSGHVAVFVNLCDGARDQDIAGREVVEALESFNVPFTGALSSHYEPSKVDMKVLARYAGLNVPNYTVVRAGDLEDDGTRLTLLTAALRFPVIVKHVSGYSSVGMCRTSRCTDKAALCVEVRRFLALFREALVEDYIEGIEVTVLTVDADESSLHTAHDTLDVGHGPAPAHCCHSFAPLQLQFPPGEDFKHFDLKWNTYDTMQWELVTDAAMDKACRAAGCTALQAIMGGRGYGRSDFRVDKDGTVWFLEINPNCGLFYPVGCESSADWVLRLDPATTPRAFAQRIIESALHRHAAQAAILPAWVVTSAALGGFGVSAARSLPANAVVFVDEGAPFHLVSRAHVQRRWPAADVGVFARYAWPLSDELFAIWSSDHTRWRPINHSCDPNLWFGEHHSLNVYARRAIAAGTELTMDYATFCAGEYMADFTCECGAAQCRRTITGLDYQHHAVLRTEYGTRVTHYVWQLASRKN